MSGQTAARSRGSRQSTAGATIPRGPGVPTSAVTVIMGWANALRGGHPQRAAAYWAHPSAMVNSDSSGSLAIVHIDTNRQALAADETLPCGATLLSARRSGHYVKAEFTLSARVGPGASSTGCTGPASVDFLIVSGHIERRLRAPVTATPPGDGETPHTGPGSQSI